MTENTETTGKRKIWVRGFYAADGPGLPADRHGDVYRLSSNLYW
jgi:hypothetical protein